MEKDEALILKTTGSLCRVLLASGEEAELRVRGRVRLEGSRSTNPVAVGDIVTVSDGAITGVRPRKNHIARRSQNWSKQSQVIAANIDLLVAAFTLCHPETDNAFIDRMLVTAEAYGIKAVLAFNKCDLFDDYLNELYEGYRRLYEPLGYECFKISALTGEGIEELRLRLRGLTTLISGNSGAGKSTLINALCPEARLRTAEISDYHDKGMHTTTFSQMLPFEGGYLIDTPGIKGFGLLDFGRAELGHYFPEIFRFSAGCRFANCTHSNEPGCAVKKAVEDHYISLSRYGNYLDMLSGDDEKYR